LITNDKLYRGNSRRILKTGENVFQKQETQFDNDFPISENANDTNTPKSDQQETPTSSDETGSSVFNWRFINNCAGDIITHQSEKPGTP
jgi:hypothetical protein